MRARGCALRASFRSLLIGASVFALAGQAGAVDYVVNTTTGVITADGTPVTSIGGTSFTVSFTGTKASFLFAGDLNIGASDTVTGVGSRAASFVAGNNANIDPGATFDFSATGSTAGAGGGGAGTGGGSGGRGSPGSGGTSGGAGNAGGALAGVGRASDGGTGGTGGNGTSGGSGGNGGTGGLGLAGVNSSSVAGGAGGAGNSGGARGTGGAGGIRADITNNCEINTPAGCISFSFTVNRNAGDGSPGNPGDDGNLGNAGNPGSGGVNSGAGLEISGGSGGGGGGKGGGGGGGWGSELRSGGDGGNGGNGGSGGAGGIGGVGGIGGAGGGAFEIIANGRANVGGALLAQGGDGTAGTGGTSGLGGSTGSGGSGGQGALGQPFPRGAGGDGGRGGTGGDGGAGGTGGAGGGGAGGTVKVVGSVTDAGGAGVDASGGTGGTAGGDGRFIIGSNTAGGAPAAVTGASTTTTTGSRAANPFIKGGLMTPQIPDLFGGAEAFGLFDGVSALASEFDAVRAGAPVDAVGALVRFDTVPFGFNDDFLGFDLVVLVNLTNAALSNPELGVDPAGTDTSFLVDLMIGGFANDPLFGGLGDVILAALDPLAVFGTLVSDTGTIFNARVGGAGVFGADLQNGGIAYLTALAPNAVPEPGTLVLFAIGLFGIAVLVRRRRPTKA